MEGSQFRLAPSRNDRMAALLWRTWAQGNEVYALGRLGRGIAHSVFTTVARSTTSWGEAKSKSCSELCACPKGRGYIRSKYAS
jgi:hypothetical protein